jgi:hypothetical protein
MKRHCRNIAVVFAAVLLSLTLAVQAQHYPPGAEGLKAATLPPPGFYLRDYNLFYYSDRVNDTDGDEVPVNFEAMVYAQAIRPIWITDLKILGASYGMDVLVPIFYKDFEVGGQSDSTFNLGDIFLEPITLSWHGDQYDAAVGYGVWAPTGEYDPDELVNPGSGFWGHMFTLGGTYYFDQTKTWSASVLGRYEINTENPDTDVTPGQYLTIEWGLGKSVTKTIEVGVVGYYQKQITESDGPGTSDDLASVASAGPEISAFCPKLKLFTSLRYLYEFTAANRPQGHTVSLTLTKVF